MGNSVVGFGRCPPGTQLEKGVVTSHIQCGSNPPVPHLSSARGLHDIGYYLRAKFVRPTNALGTQALGQGRPLSRDARYRADKGKVFVQIRRRYVLPVCARCRRLPIATRSERRCFNCLQEGLEAVARTRQKQRAIWRSSVAGIDRRQSGSQNGGLSWALVQHRERMEGYGE